MTCLAHGSGIKTWSKEQKVDRDMLLALLGPKNEEPPIFHLLGRKIEEPSLVLLLGTPPPRPLATLPSREGDASQCCGARARSRRRKRSRWCAVGYMCICVYYIYIYIYRERERHLDIYIYIYIGLYTGLCIGVYIFPWEERKRQFVEATHYKFRNPWISTLKPASAVVAAVRCLRQCDQFL